MLASLLALSLLAPPQEKPRFEDEILAFEAEDRTAKPPPGRVLFVGSSSIRLWRTLAQDFPEWDVINRGFGGSRMDDVLRLLPRIVTPYDPAAIVLFAGTNDLADGRTPEAIAADFRAFVARSREACPGVPVAFIAISPAPSRWNLERSMRRANALVRKECERTQGVWFVDTWPFMLAKGRPRPELYVADRLHLNAEGYRLWTRAIRPVVARMARPVRRSTGRNPG